MDLEDYINLARSNQTENIVNQYFYLHLNRVYENNRYHGGLYLYPKLTHSSERIIVFSFDEKAKNYRQAIRKINQWAKKQKVPLFYQSMFNIPEDAFQFIRPLKQPISRYANTFNKQHIKD